MKAIGIDIGTTSICGIVADVESGEILNSITKNSDAFIAGCAPWEKIQSVDKIMDLATGIVNSLIDDDVVTIGVTGQMHGIVYINSDGEAISPLYTWQDERGNLPYGDTTYAKYLNSFSGYGNVTDFYNRENGLRPAETVSYCTIHDYFVMKLCKLKSPIIHASDAASFGCYDLETNSFNYNYSVKIETGFAIAGTYNDIPVSVAIGDNQASVFSTLTDENNILLNVGTGSQVSIISDTPINGENIETRPYFDGKYLVCGAALCGGRAYSLLKDFYREILSHAGIYDESQIYEIMAKMIHSATDSLFVDTRFAGTRLCSDICGKIEGITTENFTPSNLTAGFLDGMVKELFDMYLNMSVKKYGIVGSGNGIRKNPALTSTFEKRFGSKMKIPSHAEEAAFGSALYALVACGIFKDRSEVRKKVSYLQ
ncbi:MAG: hypothetical protein II998_12550 [Clostridia bacterium]|nr:hypothetical protein [Clostridia bacterium]